MLRIEHILVVPVLVAVVIAGVVVWGYEGFTEPPALAPPQKTDALVASLKSEEGFRAHPYRDTRGVLTIGYGTNISQGISRDEGENLLRSRLAEKQAEISILWRPYQNQPSEIRLALLDMAYQLGVHGVLEFRDMLSALECGDYEAAADAAEDSAWDMETPRRVERIVEVFKNQEGQ